MKNGPFIKYQEHILRKNGLFSSTPLGENFTKKMVHLSPGENSTKTWSTDQILMMDFTPEHIIPKNEPFLNTRRTFHQKMVQTLI